MKRLRIIGLMSGTSLDGLDGVLAELRPRGKGFDARIIRHRHLSYPKGWAGEIRSIAAENDLLRAARFSAAWSEFAAPLVRGLARGKRADAVGASGQTVVHRPLPVPYLRRRIGVTIALVDLSRLAQRTGLRVIGNFRPADVAAGGQGAPLAPLAHRLLFARPGKILAVQNLGGIGNVTLLRGNRVALAFDTGPANVWIDTVVRWKTKGTRSFDRGGSLARRGRPDRRIVARLLAHSYFRLRPPKSAGWEEFGEANLARFRKPLSRLSTSDAVATVTHATAEATAGAYTRFVFPKGRPEKMIVAGGGARNLFLLELLSDHLSGLPVLPSDCLGVPVDQLEALAFALLAAETLRHRPGNEPAATGAKRPVLLGEIAPASLKA